MIKHNDGTVSDMEREIRELRAHAGAALMKLVPLMTELGMSGDVTIHDAAAKLRALKEQAARAEKAEAERQRLEVEAAELRTQRDEAREEMRRSLREASERAEKAEHRLSIVSKTLGALPEYLVTAPVGDVEVVAFVSLGGKKIAEAAGWIRPALAKEMRADLATAIRERDEARARLNEATYNRVTAERISRELRATCVELRAALDDLWGAHSSECVYGRTPQDCKCSLLYEARKLLSSPDPGADVLAVLRQAREALGSVSGYLAASPDTPGAIEVRGAIATIDRVLRGGK